MSAARESNPDDVTAPLVSAGTSDRCPVCGAHLAVDQRYCVECGTRRGSPRFQLAGQSVAASAAAPVTASDRSGGFSRLTRVTSGTALLVTVLIILVAVGVGVLIGHDSTNHTVVSGAPKIVVEGGSGGGTAAATGNSGAASTASSSSSTKAASTKSTPKASKATKAAASATNANAAAKGKAGTTAAAKSFSKSATNKSTVGGSCTSGTAGCSSGKQTGNLF